MRSYLLFLVVNAGLLQTTGCAGTQERLARQDIASLEVRSTSGPRPTSDEPKAELEQGLPGYVAYAMSQSPQLRASFEHWQASVHRISRARRLPEPTISFGYFVRSVETRVGPQLARVSLQQSFPWPTKLTAGADAASAQARALALRFEAQALMLNQNIAEVYWRLWLLRRTRSIHAEHLGVLRSLSESVLARIATGAATLAEHQQVELAAARLADLLQGVDEAERAAEAQLRAAIGAPGSTAVPTPFEPPAAELPAESPEALESAVRAHPLIASFEFMAKAQESVARSETADRLPGFTLGADWIITGETSMPNIPESGKDAVILGAGIRVPLWQASYADSVAAARSEANAQRAEQRAAIDKALAELETQLSSVRNAVRRVSLFRDTLVPQAQSAYESVLGAYVTGRGTVAHALLAQRDLLELRIELEQARAEYGQSWARVEQVVGHALTRRPTVAHQDPSQGATR